MNTVESLPTRDLAMMQTRLFPALRALIQMGYFSLEVEGASHVPRAGAAVYVGNHAGWFTLDTLMGALVVADHVGVDRLPYGAVQDQVLKLPGVGPLCRHIGGFPASWLRSPGRLHPAMQVFSIYPEGTEGNCKPFWRAYRMAQWRTGFARLAAARDASVVPVAIIGSEECLPVAATVRCLKPLVGSIVPVPLCPLPLPSRWKFIFHAPVRIDARQAESPETLRRFTDSIQSTVQRTLDRETVGNRLARLGKLFSLSPASP